MTEQVPNERHVISTVLNIWGENPTTELLSCAKLLLLVKQKQPEWSLGEKRLKAILKQHGLQNNSQQQQACFANEMTSHILKGLEPPSKNVEITMVRGKGKGVKAVGSIKKNSEIWSEEPLVVVPVLDKVPLIQKGNACARCAKSFRLSGLGNNHRKDAPKASKVYQCDKCHYDKDGNGGSYFCTVACRTADKEIHDAIWHNNQGLGGVLFSQWHEFEEFCVQEAWHTGYAAGRLIIAMLKSKEGLRSQIEAMARIRQDRADELLELEHDKSKLYTQGFELLKEAVSPSWKLKFEDFMLVVGTYSVNHLEGDGNLYEYQSHLNHSCEPNVRIENVPQAPNSRISIKIRVSALRDIAAGEELVMAYVDTSNDVTKRRHDLRVKYGFLCNCGKCREEDKQVHACAQAALEGRAEELAVYEELQTKMRHRRKSVRFSESIEVS